MQIRVCFTNFFVICTSNCMGGIDDGEKGNLFIDVFELVDFF